MPVYHEDALQTMQNQIDVLILCGGSATDLPVQTPKYAALYNVVDSFDTHAQHSGAFCRRRRRGEGRRHDQPDFRAAGIRACSR